jgi:hypothetical protein|tara:strand:- start:576 stop:1142 length:567 start_codon:yes stop_codon:yes gene_type:complete
MKTSDGWRFKVRTQGRLYTLNKVDPRGATTTSGDMVSAIVFEGNATHVFKKHPWSTALFWKRPCGQYYTHKVGNVVWSDENIEMPYDDVLVVKDCEIVPFEDCCEKVKGYSRDWGMKGIDTLLTAGLLFDVFGTVFILYNGNQFPTWFIVLLCVACGVFIYLGYLATKSVRFAEGLKERVQKVWETKL